MPVETVLYYGTKNFKVDRKESIPDLRNAITDALTSGGGWVIFDTPDGQVSLFVRPDVDIEIVRTNRP